MLSIGFSLRYIVDEWNWWDLANRREYLNKARERQTEGGRFMHIVPARASTFRIKLFEMREIVGMSARLLYVRD